jgi:hypothetical protein
VPSMRDTHPVADAGAAAPRADHLLVPGLPAMSDLLSTGRRYGEDWRSAEVAEVSYSPRPGPSDALHTDWADPALRSPRAETEEVPGRVGSVPEAMSAGRGQVSPGHGACRSKRVEKWCGRSVSGACGSHRAADWRLYRRPTTGPDIARLVPRNDATETFTGPLQGLQPPADRLPVPIVPAGQGCLGVRVTVRRRMRRRRRRWAARWTGGRGDCWCPPGSTPAASPAPPPRGRPHR